MPRNKGVDFGNGQLDSCLVAVWKGFQGVERRFNPTKGWGQFYGAIVNVWLTLVILYTMRRTKDVLHFVFGSLQFSFCTLMMIPGYQKNNQGGFNKFAHHYFGAMDWHRCLLLALALLLFCKVRADGIGKKYTERDWLVVMERVQLGEVLGGLILLQ